MTRDRRLEPSTEINVEPIDVDDTRPNESVDPVEATGILEEAIAGSRDEDTSPDARPAIEPVSADTSVDGRPEPVRPVGADPEGSRVIRPGALPVSLRPDPSAGPVGPGVVTPGSGAGPVTPGVVAPPVTRIDDPLNRAVYEFLTNIAPPVLDANGELSITPVVQVPANVETLRDMGNHPFRLEQLAYFPRKVEADGERFVQARLIMSEVVPYGALKEVVKSTVGRENYAYFIQEMGHRFGNPSEQDLIDLSDSPLVELVPALAELRQVNREYTVRRDPFLLLLTLDQEQREAASEMFKEAESRDMFPFNQGIEAGSSPNALSYALKASDVDLLTRFDYVIPTGGILAIGRDLGLTDLDTIYLPALHQIKQNITDIPRVRK